MRLRKTIASSINVFLNKLLISISLLIIVSACSTKHNTDIILEKRTHMMSRQEVINVIENCKSVNLRPVLYYGRRKVMDKPIPFVVDIICTPRLSN